MNSRLKIALIIGLCIAGVALAIYIQYRIAMSDLPFWVKWVLLK